MEVRELEERRTTIVGFRTQEAQPSGYGGCRAVLVLSNVELRLAQWGDGRSLVPWPGQDAPVLKPPCLARQLSPGLRASLIFPPLDYSPVGLKSNQNHFLVK